MIRESITVTGHSDDDGSAVIHVDGKLLRPGRSLRVRDHSPTGFSWGYGGSGPAQLALAVLLEAGLTSREALQVYQAFKATFIQPLPSPPMTFHISIPLAAWLAGGTYGAGSSCE